MSNAKKTIHVISLSKGSPIFFITRTNALQSFGLHNNHRAASDPEQVNGLGGWTQPRAWSQGLLFKLEQLAHEVDVGRDDGAFVLDEGEGVAERALGARYQVGEHDGGRARHARLAVHQHTPAGRQGAICRRAKGGSIIV